MKHIIILAIAIGCSWKGFSQSDTTQLASADSATSRSTVTIGAVYANNASYYGQRALESIPYAAGVAVYRHRSGFYLSGTAYRLLKDTGAFVSAGSAGAGFGGKLSKRWSADIGYSHTFYPSTSPLLQASNPNNASASLTYENWLSTKVNVDYAFGKTTDMFVTAGTGKQITLGSLSKKDVFTLTPAVELSAGTQHFYQTYIAEKRIRDSIVGALLNPVFGNPPAQNTTTKTTQTTQFNLLSYTFKCPLAYNRARYVFEIEYQISVLSNKAQSGAGKANSFLSASFYYQF